MYCPAVVVVNEYALDDTTPSVPLCGDESVRGTGEDVLPSLAEVLLDVEVKGKPLELLLFPQPKKKPPEHRASNMTTITITMFFTIYPPM